MEIGFGAMFLKMVWDTDIYQTMLTVLTIIGMYTITGGLATVAYVESLQAGIMILGSALLMGYAFYEVGGYPKLVSKYMEAIPSKTQQGNWTAQPECYLPRQDAFHIFRSCVSGDIPWPGLILGATTVSLFYGCADQSIFMLFLLGWIFVPIYSKAEVVTLPEYLKKRFGSLRIQLFFTFIFLIVYIFSRISMEIGFGAMFLKMVWDTDIYQTMLTVLTIIGMYTITGTVSESRQTHLKQTGERVAH